MTNTLSILGCDPALLNPLMELAEDALKITYFDILLNIPVEIGPAFQPLPHWTHQVYALNDLTQEHKAHLSTDGQFAFSMGESSIKVIVYKAFKQTLPLEQKQFTRLIHPSSVVSRSATLGFGVQIESLTTVSACTTLGFGVNIKRNSSVGHHCVLDDFVTLNPGVTLSSFVHVGKGTRIGTGTSVRDHISIGENCMIGMGSVVVKDIPAHSIAYGNPCKVQGQNLRRES